MEITQSHPCPDRGGLWDIPDIERLHQRWELQNEKGMYAYVCWDWVVPLADWLGERKVLEIMSGAGWLAKALRMRGIDLKATDDFTWIDKNEWPLRTEVERISAIEAVKKYGKDIQVMICSWPYMDNDFYQAFKLLYKVNPSALVIYIGEWEDGCTANFRFFRHFQVIADHEFAKVSRAYKTWWGLHDRMYLGTYTHYR